MKMPQLFIFTAILVVLGSASHAQDPKASSTKTPTDVQASGGDSGKRTTAIPFLPGETSEQYWDRAYSDAARVLPAAPNAFLTRAVKGVKPGRALDIGVGQGRNAIYLAKLGWDVTGFDISERGMEQAGKSAAAVGVKIATVKASIDEFDYGVEKWDLIVATYEGVSWLRAGIKGLKPGGLIVVEGYASHPDAPTGAAFGHNELLRLFMDQNLEVVRYEDVNEEPDWIKLDGVVRMCARKPR